GYANCCEALAKADLRGELKQITIPVLIIAGTLDPVTTVTDAELPEFDRKVLEVLRQPLESKEIVISRAARQMTFPANFQFIAA
uniref:ATP-binding protein n=1 Tax=Acinetobacter junii TaxID=40215 RepID=UPI001D197DE7